MRHLDSSTPRPGLTMQALVLNAYDGQMESLSLVEKSIPQPGKGQVLVRMHAAPVNPSDLAFLRGMYGRELKKLPVVAGFEGSGTVVGVGGGIMPRLLRGQRVACAAPEDGDGTWAEYMVTPASLCMPLSKGTTLEQGAVLLVNPLTAWAFMDIARRSHSAIVFNAAASALGSMVRSLSRSFGVDVISVVRGPEQAALLRSNGVENVLESSDLAFDDDLRNICRRLKITLAFDAVGGEMTGRLLEALQPRGRVIVYGGLSGEECRIDPRVLIFGGKCVESFWLPNWLARQNQLALLRIGRRVQSLLAAEMKAATPNRVFLSDARTAIAQYEQQMTGSKVMIMLSRLLDNQKR